MLTIASAVPTVKLPHLTSCLILLLSLIPLYITTVITYKMSCAAPPLLFFWGSSFLCSLPLSMNVMKMISADLTMEQKMVEICNLVTIILSLVGFCLEMIPLGVIGSERQSHLSNLFFVHMDKYFLSNLKKKSHEREFEIPGTVVNNDYETFENHDDTEDKDVLSESSATYFNNISVERKKQKNLWRKITLSDLILKHACGSYVGITALKILSDLSYLMIPLLLSALILHVQNVKRSDCGDI